MAEDKVKYIGGLYYLWIMIGDYSGVSMEWKITNIPDQGNSVHCNRSVWTIQIQLVCFTFWCVDVDLGQGGNERDTIECVSNPDHCEAKLQSDGANLWIICLWYALVKPLPAAATSSGAFLPWETMLLLKSSMAFSNHMRTMRKDARPESWKVIV